MWRTIRIEILNCAPCNSDTDESINYYLLLYYLFLLLLKIYNYLNINNILPTRNSGFTRGYNTTTSISCLPDTIIRSRKKRLNTALVFMDYSKAFGIIDHGLLHGKLMFLGFDSRTMHRVSYVSPKLWSFSEMRFGSLALFDLLPLRFFYLCSSDWCTLLRTALSLCRHLGRATSILLVIT